MLSLAQCAQPRKFSRSLLFFRRNVGGDVRQRRLAIENENDHVVVVVVVDGAQGNSICERR